MRCFGWCFVYGEVSLGVRRWCGVYGSVTVHVFIRGRVFESGVHVCASVDMSRGPVYVCRLVYLGDTCTCV